ncbi:MULTISPECIES: HD domain-containing phosphohydrolase [unclassified Pseudodesulfovibrio]|uniref:HD domain-containing phosphohydrolase n=1 Tax=unclassified Pseudodesulfovibrio TaxID=2661612 RepID=UPI000FEBC89E|nr:MULTISPECIES: HD domain-containing phosphohydrolase [unclassified Pseudodesulfovibrio]MCJ2164767.1 response regulator [Pseudodesulfovibrio sp. S3-i]RWU04047.1 response regulator [Pseudodesulfovibrio sp. S3]
MRPETPHDYTNERILFVDDEPKVLDSYRRSLRTRFKVSTALGGKAALELLEAEEPFTVVISDIKMPTMDGVELLSRIQARYPDTIRMVLTGYADLETSIKAVNQGDIFRFLTKPCDTGELENAVIAGIRQHRMRRAAQELAVMRQINEGMEGTLKAFTRLVEFRDPYTAGHMERVADISSLIATRIGLDADSIRGLHFAALVHDIGKVAVPAGILNKPGSLSDAEFAIIKAHPLVGAEIFQTLKTDWPITRIIREHHERLDGTGYPSGLREDEILLESQVLAVADVIDAILTNRPYRPTLGQKEAINILEHAKGTQLNARCVEAGIKIILQGLVFGDTFSGSKA